MGMVTLLKLILSFASSLASYVHDKRLMDAGASEAILKGLEEVNEKIAGAKSARANADSVSVDADPYNRDNG